MRGDSGLELAAQSIIDGESGAIAESIATTYPTGKFSKPIFAQARCLLLPNSKLYLIQYVLLLRLMANSTLSSLLP